MVEASRRHPLTCWASHARRVSGAAAVARETDTHESAREATARPRLAKLRQRLGEEEHLRDEPVMPAHFATSNNSGAIPNIPESRDPADVRARVREQIGVAKQAFPDLDFSKPRSAPTLEDSFGRHHNYLR